MGRKKKRNTWQWIILVAACVAGLNAYRNISANDATDDGALESVTAAYEENETSDVEAQPVATAKEEGKTEEADTWEQENAISGLEVPVNVSMKAPEQMLRRTGYVTSYNKDTRTPNWVGWVLTAEHTDGDNTRQKKFLEDEDVPEPRALYSDIREGECGYQRGHICPAADNKWSYKAQKDAFLMTNICPQNGELNQRDWKYLEEECREWAKKYGKVYITAGPVFSGKSPKRVGENRVAVPDAFFKVVLTLGSDGRHPKAIGFIYDNADGQHEMSYYVRTVDKVEETTGLDFFSQLDDDVENKVEAQADLSEW